MAFPTSPSDGQTHSVVGVGTYTYVAATDNWKFTSNDPSAVLGFSLIDRQVFTADGTYTPTPGMRFVIVEVQGAGGGSGGCATTNASQNSGGSGAGGGGYSQKKILASAIGTTETVTVGVGGAAGAAGNNVGTVGEDSTFGSHCTGSGGGQGGGGPVSTLTRTQITGGVGGAASGGDVNIPGGNGSWCMLTASISSIANGFGGSSYFAGEQGGTSITTVAAAVAGKNYGGGASGAALGVSQTQIAGAAGADGIIIVWEYGDVITTNGPLESASLRGLIDGFITSNGTDATNDIDIAVGACRDAANVRTMELTSALGKQIDVDWAEGGTPGAPAGGFPSALTLTNDTWYHMFIIGKVDGTLDAGFDTSLTAANLLTDASAYTDYRRIGSVKRVTAANVAYIQYGDYFMFDASPLSSGIDYDASPGATSFTIEVSVPPDVVCLALLNVSNNGDQQGLFYEGDLTDIVSVSNT